MPDLQTLCSRVLFLWHNQAETAFYVNKILSEVGTTPEMAVQEQVNPPSPTQDFWKPATQNLGGYNWPATTAWATSLV